MNEDTPETQSVAQEPETASDDFGPRAFDEQLGTLARQLSKYTSYRAAFLRGVVYGVGTALGASVIAAALFALGYNFIKPILPGAASDLGVYGTENSN